MEIKNVSRIVAVSFMLIFTVLPVLSQQNVLVSNGAAPPAGSQLSGVTVNGGTITTGGIINNGTIHSVVSGSGQTTSFDQTPPNTVISAGPVGDPSQVFSEINVSKDQASLSSGAYNTGSSYVQVMPSRLGMELQYVNDTNQRVDIGIVATSQNGIFLGNAILGSGQSNGLYINGSTAQFTGDLGVGGKITADDGVVANGRVQNVEAGVASTDAVNVQQLHQLDQQITYSRRIASTGSAIAMAAASVPALEGGKRFGVGVGTGTYDGRSAISIAGIARINGTVQMKFNIGTGSDGKTAAGAGALMSW